MSDRKSRAPEPTPPRTSLRVSTSPIGLMSSKSLAISGPATAMSASTSACRRCFSIWRSRSTWRDFPRPSKAQPSPRRAPATADAAATAVTSMYRIREMDASRCMVSPCSLMTGVSAGGPQTKPDGQRGRAERHERDQARGSAGADRRRAPREARVSRSLRRCDAGALSTAGAIGPTPREASTCCSWAVRPTARSTGMAGAGALAMARAPRASPRLRRR